MEANVIDAKKGVGSSMTFEMSDEEMSMMVSVGTRLSIACALTGDSVDTYHQLTDQEGYQDASRRTRRT